MAEARLARPTLRLLTLAACLAGATTFGCGGPATSVTQTWKAELPEPTVPMRSVLVMAANMDATNRRAFEDAFARRLSSHGITARVSYRMFPDRLPDRQAARAAASGAKVDGILVATYKGSRQVERYVPGSYADGFWSGYYGRVSGNGTYDQGYVEPAQVASLEVSLWDARLRDGPLVWAASTQTVAPSPGREFTRSVVDKVVPDIAKAGLIPPEK